MNPALAGEDPINENDDAEPQVIGAHGNTSEEDDEDQLQQYVNADFEGRVMIDADFIGIRNLLQRANGLVQGHGIDPSFLTNLLIGQNYIGSVFKQLFDGEEEDEEEDDMNDLNVVYGIVSVLNLKEREGEEGQVVQQIRQALVTRSTECADTNARSIVNDLLANESKSPIGFLINERMLGIIGEIAAPLFKALRTEMQKAVKQGMAFGFQRFVMFSRVKILPQSSSENGLTIWCNSEEQSLSEAAICTFPFFTANSPDEDGFIESHRCLIITADVFDKWVTSLQPEQAGSH